MNFLGDFKESKSIQMNIAIDCDDIEMLVLEYANHHFELYLNDQQIKYRNVLSPAEYGYSYPEEYLAARYAGLNNEKTLQGYKLVKDCLLKLPFENDLELLPPGASHEAYIRLVFKSGNTFFYTNTHVSETVFSLKSDPPMAEFTRLYDFLLPFCSFPTLYDLSGHDEVITITPDDHIDYNETLWMCANCSAGNPFSETKCYKCGQDRGW